MDTGPADPEQLEDARLMALAAAGDRDAFAAVVTRYQGRMRAYVARHVATLEDVHDLVQDAFLAAYQAVGDFDPRRPLWPWLRAICHNHVCNHFRRRAVRERGHAAIVDAALAATPEPDVEPAEVAADERLAAALRRCLERLPGPDRELLDWRYRLGEAVSAIAGRLGLRPNSVSMRLNRLRAALHDCARRGLAEELR